MSEITKKIENVQKEWSKYILDIGEAFRNGKDYKKLGEELLDKLYSFDNNNKISFKPTMPGKKNFRFLKKDVLSYFIGSKDQSNNDSGFALKGWKKIIFDNYNLKQINNIVLAMGAYFFQDSSNKTIEVEYTFAYLIEDSDNLKIILHHSSIPYLKN